MVNRYADSPALLIKNGGRLINNLSYMDAVLQYSDKISLEYIDKATKIAGRSFPGQMEMNFLILKDTECEGHLPISRWTYIPSVRDMGSYKRTRGRGIERGQFRSMRTGMVQMNNSQQYRQPNSTWASVITGANVTPIQQHARQPIQQNMVQFPHG